MKIFADIIKKFRSSIFAEYVPMLLVVLAFFAIAFFVADRNPPNKDGLSKIAEAIRKVEAEQPPRIVGNETEEEIYNNPYIKHIRTALNGYLDGSNTGAEEAMALDENKSDECGLDSFDKSYYRSKFFLYDVSDNDYGGVQAYIVFVDKPDTIFWAWVYRLGGDGEYSLRGFCKAGPPDESRDKFIQTMRSFIESGEMKFSL